MIAPTVDCPACGREFQVPDYFEISEGDEVECRHCHTTIVCASIEHVMEWTWTTASKSEATS